MVEQKGGSADKSTGPMNPRKRTEISSSEIETTSSSETEEITRKPQLKLSRTKLKRIKDRITMDDKDSGMPLIDELVSEKLMRDFNLFPYGNRYEEDFRQNPFERGLNIAMEVADHLRSLSSSDVFLSNMISWVNKYDSRVPFRNAVTVGMAVVLRGFQYTNSNFMESLTSRSPKMIHDAFLEVDAQQFQENSVLERVRRDLRIPQDQLFFGSFLPELQGSVPMGEAIEDGAIAMFSVLETLRPWNNSGPQLRIV